MDSHHLVLRLVVVVYICVIYLLTLAAHGTGNAIGTFNKPVLHSSFKMHLITVLVLLYCDMHVCQRVVMVHVTQLG